MVSTQMLHSQLSHELHSATTKTTTRSKRKTVKSHLTAPRSWKTQCAKTEAHAFRVDPRRPKVQKQKHMNLD